MIRNTPFLNIIKNWQRNTIQRAVQSSRLNIEKLEQEAEEVDVVDDELRLKEELLEKKRNKSRLNDAHRNILFDNKPYDEVRHPSHATLRYQRRLYGKFGESSGVGPSICWPIKSELNDNVEYEKVAYPLTIPKMIEDAKISKAEGLEKIQMRESQIIEKMKKLDYWIKEMKDKVQKKESEALVAKERKDKLIEEVRRYFGYTIDSRDERFKEMLEKKEREQKKTMKEARKKAKELKMMEKLNSASPSGENEEIKN